ncbi:DUF4232 domain-containing protein [Streptomyces sp. NPDC059828]|uniref:DUF4232 domain-containing protein n=1 Tax=Streptomyces sp. NPDC059828 TaxID=3346965 RepID=UPI0036575098
MNTIRSRTAIAALAAGLSLTACQHDDASSGATPPAGGTASNGTSATAGSGTADSGTVGSGMSPGVPMPTATRSGQSGSGDAAASGACTSAHIKVVVSKVSRPLNHLLLAVTNTGSTACDAYGAPVLRFDDEQAAVQLVEDSRPQAVVSLQPGVAAYASINLTGEPGAETDGRPARKLAVQLTSGSGSESVGSPTNLNLPPDVFKDDSAAVTYWQSDAQDALTY